MENGHLKNNVMSFLDLMNKDIPPITYLVEGLIQEAGLVYCFGAPGSFKTSFMLYAALQGCQGNDVFNFEVKKKFNTLWIDEENREIGMNDKIKKISMGIGNINNNDIANNYVLISNSFNIIDNKYLIYLRELIEEHNPKMVVIDSIAKVFPLDERNERDVKKIYACLAPLINDYGVTFVLIHHARKKGREQYSQNMEDISGSREFMAMADQMLLLEEKDNSNYRLRLVKNRHAEKNCDINFNVIGDEDSLGIYYLGDTKKVVEKLLDGVKQAIIAWYEGDNLKEFRRIDVVNALRKNRIGLNKINDALKGLKSDGVIYQEMRCGIYKVK